PNAAGGRIHVAAATPSAEFFGQVASTRQQMGTRGITAVFRLDDGTVLLDTGCGLRDATPEIAGELRRAVAGLTHPDAPVVRLIELQGEQTQPLLAGIAAAARTGWGVLVVVDQAEFAAPFMSARVKYVAFMALIILTAALIVLHGIRNDLNRLTAIARAA